MKILKFSASWCMPCKQLSQTISTLSEEQRAKFEEIDVDECDKSLLSQYGVRSVPTLVVLNDQGNVVRTLTGNQPKAKLIELL